jgi:transposase-like protein
MKRTQHTREFENQALIKVRERAGKSVRTIAQELHMAEGTLRKWMSKSNQKASLPTPAATSNSHFDQTGAN